MCVHGAFGNNYKDVFKLSLQSRDDPWWVDCVPCIDFQPTGPHPLLRLTAWCASASEGLLLRGWWYSFPKCTKWSNKYHLNSSFQLNNRRTSCRSFKNMFSAILCSLSLPVFPAPPGQGAQPSILLTWYVVFHYFKSLFSSSSVSQTQLPLLGPTYNIPTLRGLQYFSLKKFLALFALFLGLLHRLHDSARISKVCHQPRLERVTPSAGNAVMLGCQHVCHPFPPAHLTAMPKWIPKSASQTPSAKCPQVSAVVKSPLLICFAIKMLWDGHPFRKGVHD